MSLTSRYKVDFVTAKVDFVTAKVDFVTPSARALAAFTGDCGFAAASGRLVADSSCARKRLQCAVHVCNSVHDTRACQPSIWFLWNSQP